MSDYIHDMNRDGKIDMRDHALFHEMLNESKETQPTFSTSSSSNKTHGLRSKKVYLIPIAVFMYSMVKGVLPLNEVTAILFVVCAIAGFRLIMR